MKYGLKPLIDLKFKSDIQWGWKFIVLDRRRILTILDLSFQQREDHITPLTWNVLFVKFQKDDSKSALSEKNGLALTRLPWRR